MHGHLPSLLAKATSLLPQIGHFFRHFARFVDVGLLSTQSWLGIPSPRRIRQREIERDAKTPTHLGCPSADVGGLVQPAQSDLGNRSLIPPEIADQPSKKKLIISIHVPKTGGMTFVKILRKCAEEVLYLDYSQEGLGSTTLLLRRKRLTTPFESVVDGLESLPGRSVIHGHFSPKKYSDRFPNAVYITWLRDPVERVASHYFYWQRMDLRGDPRWEQVVMQKMSLEEFAELDFTRNVYFRWLSPWDVERFDFIGITEEYGRSLELFRRLICPEIKLRATVKNHNPNRRGNFYGLDRDLRRKILELNQRDAYIYLDGVRRFRCLCDQVGV